MSLSDEERDYLVSLRSSREHLKGDEEKAGEALSRLGDILEEEERDNLLYLIARIDLGGVEIIDLDELRDVTVGSDEEPTALRLLLEALGNNPLEPIRLRAGRMAFSESYVAGESMDSDLLGQFMERLKQGVVSEDEGVRVACIWTIFKFKGDEAFDEFTHAIFHAGPVVKGEIARFLGFLKNKRAVPYLLMALKDEPLAKVRSTILWALGYIGDDRAYESLAQSLREDDDAEARGYAAWALGEIGMGEAREDLRSAMTDEAEEVRYWASRALLKLED